MYLFFFRLLSESLSEMNKGVALLYILESDCYYYLIIFFSNTGNFIYKKESALIFYLGLNAGFCNCLYYHMSCLGLYDDNNSGPVLSNRKRE